MQAIIPISAIVQTQDGNAQYTVIKNTAHPAYSDTLGGYVVSIDISSLQVPVTAIIAGSNANVAKDAINTLTTAIVGIDTVTNDAALTNGRDAETDAAFRERFINYMASLSKATQHAVGYAITSLKAGLNYTLVENETYAGAKQPGFFYVLVDDGTGNPPSTLLSDVYNALDIVRPLGITFAVFASELVAANVVMTITTRPDYDYVNVAVEVKAALANYINTLGLGKTLAYTRLSQVAYDASAGVDNVSSITLNNTTHDLAASNKQMIKVGTVTVA
jgi:uncharacterized phage protein gp47/JayE